MMMNSNEDIFLNEAEGGLEQVQGPKLNLPNSPNHDDEDDELDHLRQFSDIDGPEGGDPLALLGQQAYRILH